MVRLVVRLVDLGGSPLSGRTVYFYVSGDGSSWVDIGSAVTDDGGYAYMVYDALGRTWFRVEFRGDDYYEPVDAVAVWEPSEEVCEPVVRVGFLDDVLFCIGGRGVTVFIALVVAFFVLMWLIRRR